MRKSLSAETTIVFYEFIRNLLKYYVAYSIFAVIFYFLADLFYKQISVLHPINYLLLSMVIHITAYHTLFKMGNVGELNKLPTSEVKENDKRTPFPAEPQPF